MEIYSSAVIVLLVLAVSLLPCKLQSTPYTQPYSWLNIDCGMSNTWQDPLTSRLWNLDDDFIKTGRNILLSVTTDRLPLETLRYFPDGTKNCYKLPLYVQNKYIIRAGFYYGNYDNLFKPPTFNLIIDDNLWANVTTSLGTDPVYHELVYFTRKKYVSICLIQAQQGQIPFISSLEAMPLPSNMYRLMDNKTAFYLEHRTNYGANQSVPERFDWFNRFWTPEQLPNYQNLFSGDNYGYSSSAAENYPPYIALDYAIRGQNKSDSIFVPIDFHDKKAQLSAYFVFYFYHVGLWPGENNVTMQIVYIDGVEKNATTVSPDWDCVVVSVYPVKVTAKANVTIAAAQGTTQPPILNAMEVFTTIEVSASHHHYSSLNSGSFGFVFLGLLYLVL